MLTFLITYHGHIKLQYLIWMNLNNKQNPFLPLTISFLWPTLCWLILFNNFIISLFHYYSGKYFQTLLVIIIIKQHWIRFLFLNPFLQSSSSSFLYLYFHLIFPWMAQNKHHINYYAPENLKWTWCFVERQQIP